ALMWQIESYKNIRDPLKTVLSADELKLIKSLIGKHEINISHLSEEEWIRFTEVFAYDTNAIEGSTVDLAEVRNILEKDKWPDREKWEIAETYGVSDAINFIRTTKDHLSIGLIKELHKIVFKNSKEYAGKLRPHGVEVIVANKLGEIIHRGAPQNKVLGLLKELVVWYRKNKMRYHPIVLAAVVHNQFENIHPFQDGNGRVGRLLLNNILLKHGLPPVNIELKNRKQYYASLQAYERGGNLRPSIELILKSYIRLRKSI
ncbi:MAG: Fic family protein, partial [Candidatus Altiarchaeota archaeon]|nr:Fic family protein [Candidatus Altiarchaeota archaeon]